MGTDKDKHFKGKVAQKALIVKDDKVLLVRGHRSNGFWELPGGRLHIDETFDEGIRREVKEELGIEVKVENILFSEIKTHKHSQEKTLFLFYLTSLGDNQVVKLPTIEIAEAAWVTKDNYQDYQIYNECKRAVVAFFTVE